MTNKSALGLGLIIAAAYTFGLGAGLIIYVGYAFVLIGLLILLLEAIKEEQHYMKTDRRTLAS